MRNTIELRDDFIHPIRNEMIKRGKLNNTIRHGDHNRCLCCYYCCRKCCPNNIFFCTLERLQAADIIIVSDEVKYFFLLLSFRFPFVS